MNYHMNLPDSTQIQNRKKYAEGIPNEIKCMGRELGIQSVSKVFFSNPPDGPRTYRRPIYKSCSSSYQDAGFHSIAICLLRTLSYVTFIQDTNHSCSDEIWFPSGSYISLVKPSHVCRRATSFHQKCRR